MTKDQWLDMLESAKKIERLSDYLYSTNKLRAEQIKMEAAKIINQVNGQLDNG